MIIPSTVNVFTIGASVLIFVFLWRAAAAALAERPLGQAMAAIL